jgi:hypothetical protein
MNSNMIYNAIMNIATKNEDTGEYTVKHEDICKLMTPKPKRGLTALRAYMTTNKDDIKSKHPEKCKVQGGFLKMASHEYNLLDDDSKTEYILISEKDSDRYKREIAEYHMIFADKTKTKVKGSRGRPKLNPEEKKERADKKKKNAKVSNNSEDDTGDITPIIIDEMTYYLDSDTNKIYNQNSDHVGDKTETGYTLN